MGKDTPPVGRPTSNETERPQTDRQRAADQRPVIAIRDRDGTAQVGATDIRRALKLYIVANLVMVGVVAGLVLVRIGPV